MKLAVQNTLATRKACEAINKPEGMTLQLDASTASLHETDQISLRWGGGHGFGGDWTVHLPPGDGQCPAHTPDLRCRRLQHGRTRSRDPASDGRTIRIRIESNQRWHETRFLKMNDSTVQRQSFSFPNQLSPTTFCLPFLIHFLLAFLGSPLVLHFLYLKLYFLTQI